MKKAKTTIGELVDNYTRSMEMVRKIGVRGAARKLSVIREVIKLVENYPADDIEVIPILEKLKDQAVWINFAIGRYRVEIMNKQIAKKTLTQKYLEDKEKAAEYGRMSRKREKNEAILSSIINEIKNGGNKLSATDLWNRFKRKYNGIENINENNVYYCEDFAADKHEIKEIGNPKGITFNTFRTYVTKAKKIKEQ